MNRITAQSPANRLPLYPQHRTFRGPRWTSGFDPEQSFVALGAMRWSCLLRCQVFFDRQG